MRQGRIRGACVVIALLCGLGFCAEAAPQTKTDAMPEIKKMTREVIDETGRRVAVPVDGRRIVTLAPNLTEIVYALRAQDRLVGVSNYSDYPAAAKAKPRVGMQLNPNLEAIFAARPDIVLVAAVNRFETVDALARLGIAVYGTDPHTVEGTLASIEHIGGVIGASVQAESVVANLRKRLDALKAKLVGVPPARVLFVVWQDPLTSLGTHTFIADALRFADAQSVVEAKQDWPQISLEEVVRLNPDYLVFASGHFGDAGARAQRLAELRSEAGWRELNAVREGHVAVISDEINLPAPGLIDAIEQLARQLHPSVFAQTPQPHASARQSPAFAPAFAQLRGRPFQKLCVEAIACTR